MFAMLYMVYKVTAHEAGLSNRLSRARLRPTLLASDAVEVVHDVSRLLLNSPIGARAGSSHSGGTSQHLAGLAFLLA